MTEDKLFYPVMHIPSLRYLVITGNPFAVTPTGSSIADSGVIPNSARPAENTQTLQLVLDQKGGQLINENLQAPTYLRRTAGAATRSTRVGTNSIGSRGTAGSSAF